MGIIKRLLGQTRLHPDDGFLWLFIQTGKSYEQAQALEQHLKNCYLCRLRIEYMKKLNCLACYQRQTVNLASSSSKGGVHDRCSH